MAARSDAQRGTAGTILRGDIVVCGRCGATMFAEQIWQEGTVVPLLRWRCDTGHVTQAIPVPESLNSWRASVRPAFTEA